MGGVPGRHGAEWRRARAECLKGATMCQMPDCRYPGQPLVHGGSRKNPLRATADHLIRVMDTTGWSDQERRLVLNNPRYLRPAHMACNSARNQNPPKRRVKPVPASRDWGI